MVTVEALKNRGLVWQSLCFFLPKLSALVRMGPIVSGLDSSVFLAARPWPRFGGIPLWTPRCCPRSCCYGLQKNGLYITI